MLDVGPRCTKVSQNEAKIRSDSQSLRANLLKQYQYPSIFLDREPHAVKVCKSSIAFKQLLSCARSAKRHFQKKEDEKLED